MAKIESEEAKILFYLRGDARRRPKRAEGLPLAHNRVALSGNGWRAFFLDKLDPSWKLCSCGWRDLGKHYAQKGPRKFSGAPMRDNEGE